MARGKRETNGATSAQAARLGLAEAALAATGDAVTIADARGYLLLMNEAAKRMAQVVPTLGLPLARQEPVFALRHPDGSRVAPRDTPLARALCGEAVDDQPFRIARPDGRDAIVRAFAVPVKDAGGSIIGAATIFRDVTEKETAEDALRVISQRLEATIKERTSSLTLANEALLAEVASLRQTLEVLRASEQCYRALAETARESLFVVNREDVIDYVNAYGAGQLGLHPADIIGRPRRALFPPSIAESQAAHLRQVFDTGNPVYAEEMIPLAGRERWLGTWLAPLKDEAGAIWAVAGFSRDITESRQAEEALRRSEETSRGVLNALPANIAVLDSSGTILAVNEAWRRFARENGAPHLADVSVGMNYLAVCARAAGEQSELAKEALVGIHEVLVGERELFVLEYPCDSPTEKHWVILYATPLSKGRGGAVVSHLDITRRKQAEEAVRESEVRFRNLVETTSDWVWEVDERCVYSYAGPQLKDILGYEPQEVLGRTPFDLMPAEEARRVEGLFNDIVSRHAPFHGLENTNRHKDGHLVVLETSGVPFYDAEGRFRGYRGIDRDITERKRAELQREQVEQMREEFIRTVGHDLRHPLTIILGQAELLKRAQQKAGAMPEALRSLEAIATSARRMAEMLQDLLEATSLEAGQVVLNTIAVETSAYLMDLGARLAGTAEGKRVRIEVPERLPAVKADPARLERIMMNLLTNALKYSPPTEEVLVNACERDGGVVVSVSDRGPGIPSDELPYLFERFYRTRATREREEGLGLGLYITRMLVEAQGGHIWAESELGKGSTFFFSLPTA